MLDTACECNDLNKLLYVLNSTGFFLSHRLPLAIEAKAKGYEVHIASPSDELVGVIREQGFYFHNIPVSRSGLNPFKELFALFSLYRVFVKLNPTIVHLVTVKPVLYGSIAARLAGVPGVVAAVSGLGFVFTSRAIKARILKLLLRVLYKLAFKHRNLLVIFQNPTDRDSLIKQGVLSLHQSVLIRGSGVDLDSYPALPEPRGREAVVMASRLLRDKGVVEFVTAARLIKARGFDVEFMLAGDLDPSNPSSISGGDLDAWKAEGVVKLLGQRSDIHTVFAGANIVVLPSYREGLPKVLVEAAACGRAVVTTDVPGCRDAIDPDVSGILVPVRNAGALADAIQRLLEDRGLRAQMGHAGRALSEREFGIEKIVAAHMDVYDSLERHVWH